MLQPPLEESDIDDNFKQAVEVVTQYDRASASLIQRRLGIGYARSARIIDQLEAAGVVGPAEGSAPREVLIHSPEDVLGKKGDRLVTEPDNPYDLPANYKVPADVDLSSSASNPWGKLFGDIYKGTDFKNTKAEFPLHLGFDDAGKLKTESLIEVNNLIIAGNPLSQKENFVDTILLTNLLRYEPSELKMILIDLTHYLDLYNGIAHLLSPVINDYDKSISALKWSLMEMERRQKQFAETGVRDLVAYNEKSGMGIPRILIICFWDLYGVETEDAFIRLTGQGGRTGIHSILVADRTSGASLSTAIKSNIPARAVFKLTSAGESKAIDVSGAEKLEPGEIIYKPNYGNPEKLKPIFTPEINVKEVVEAVKTSSS